VKEQEIDPEELEKQKEILRHDEVNLSEEELIKKAREIINKKRLNGYIVPTKIGNREDVVMGVL